jgi:hypothetical protein
MRNILKAGLSKVRVETYERLLAHSIQSQKYPELKSLPLYGTRTELWDQLFAKRISRSDKILYVEFGVYKGESIRNAARQNTNSESVFIGLDSFEGLPADWGDLPKGSFSTDGITPVVDDQRISFIKGWFQNSWDGLYERLKTLKDHKLVVHLDADLYSSTLFALTKIDILKENYIAVFDEFTGHETRALFDYQTAYGARVEFFSKTHWNGKPFQVSCAITVNNSNVALSQIV